MSDATDDVASTRLHWLTLARHTPLGLLLDLDGTLIPFAPSPDEARVTPELLELLRTLVQLPGLTVAVVSGRPRVWLDTRLSEVEGLLLVAEHGGWRRGSGAWESPVQYDSSALDGLAAELSVLVERTPGALLERKTWSLTLHSRRVPALTKDAFLVEAGARVMPFLEREPSFERVEGAEVIEIRPAGMRKASAVPWVRERAGAGARLVAVGDDVTDEHMFAALSPHDEAILVRARTPDRTTAARFRVRDPMHVRALLAWLIAVRRGETLSGEHPELPFTVRTHPIQRDTPARRLVVVSNRLPDLRLSTTSSDSPGEHGRKRNVGGLVSALEPALARRGGIWLGWSGQTVPDTDPARHTGVEHGETTSLAWIDFKESWYRGHYNGFCNRALWPLFHTFPARVAFSEADWRAHLEVTEAFADAICELVDRDEMVWIHDYHLMWLARALRRRGHTGRIGHFLHIPFPPVDVLTILPWADDLLDALTEHDLVGFHTPGYLTNFRRACSVRLGAAVADDAVMHRGRRVRVGAFPIGIFPAGFQEPVDASVAEETAALMRAIAPCRLVLGVDRLDYTKGIPERLLAFGRMLELFPEWRGKVSLVQVSVPSRADVPEYEEQRTRIENIVGRINGEYGEAHWVPIRYLYRSYGRAQLAELYRAADVGYVTPLRDGMNLVAKEYVAAQDRERPGVLLLSELAGAAHELRDAVLTNPWYVDGMARDLDRALKMGEEERRSRHARLLAVVERTTALTWAEDFLAVLEPR